MPLTSSSMMLPSCVNSRPTNAARCAAPCDRCTDTKPHAVTTGASECHCRFFIRPAGCRRSAMPTASVWWRAALCLLLVRLGGIQSEELVPQFEQALKNILAVLAQAGGIPSHICRLTAFYIDKPAYLAGRRDLAHLEFADGKSFPRDEHDFCCRSSRRPGKDRAGSDRRHSRLKN